MANFNPFAGIRREYGKLSLLEEELEVSPIIQFKKWFAEVLQVEITDPTAMVLATVDEEGHPDTRVVLLKGIESENFVFFSNYESKKGLQINRYPFVALNFYWPQMARQVRIKGKICQIAEIESDSYFSSRPVSSQIAAIVSPQSRKIKDRESLEREFNELLLKQEPNFTRPSYWGGYQVMPKEIEFWQGRDNRLHDRIRYYKESAESIWMYERLAP